MAIKLRLARRGRTNAAFFRVVVADARSKRDGRFIEDIGIYQPMVKDETKQLVVDEAKALKWLHEGAMPSDTVRSLLRRKGIMKKYHDAKLATRKARAAAKV